MKKSTIKTYPTSYSMILSTIFLLLLLTFNYILVDLKLISSFQDLNLFDITLIALACFRLVRLFVYDSVAQFIRDFFLDIKEDKVGHVVMIHRSKPRGGVKRLISDLLGCPWCTSVWVALFATFFYYLIPGLWFAYLVLVISGLGSFIQIFTNKIGWQAEYNKGVVAELEKSQACGSGAGCGSNESTCGSTTQGKSSPGAACNCK